VVFVAHTPDAVLRVVVARELGLPPERSAELLRPAPARDNSEHFVLDIGSEQHAEAGKSGLVDILGVTPKGCHHIVWPSVLCDGRMQIGYLRRVCPVERHHRLLLNLHHQESNSRGY
jgi:hypothetical protein